MTDITQILSQAESGDPAASQQLFEVVYDQLRGLAARQLAHEKPGQTLQATALVHEAWIKLSGERSAEWENRGHFFAAAGEAMRRILVDVARRKLALKRGGAAAQVSLDNFADMSFHALDNEILVVHEALDALAAEDQLAADLVKLHYFGGLSIEEAGSQLGLSRATAYRVWNYGRAWLRASMQDDA